MRILRSQRICAVLMSAGACVPSASTPDVAIADALIRESVEAGGREDPSAAYYLELAERELARARLLVRAHDAEGARSFARLARADAEVARLCAIEAAALDAARRTEADAMELERRIEAGSDPAGALPGGRAR